MRPKNLAIIGIILLLLFTTSCGGQAENSVDSDNNSSSSSTNKDNISQSSQSNPTAKDPILWGDSIEKVKKKESSILLDEIDNTICYESIIFNQTGNIFYRFDDNGNLNSVFAVIEISMEDSDSIFKFYEESKAALSEKYGVSEDIIIPTDIGNSIDGNGYQEFLQGNIFLTSSWESTDITAKIQVSPDNTNALISINVEKKPEFVAEEISVGETYIIPDLCEFTINYVELKKEVTPPHPVNYYTYYPEEDGKTYIDLSISIKNTRTTRRSADQFGIVKAICGDNYEYNAFSIIEEKNGSDFTYTNITDVDPLETANIHYLASIPNELADENTSPIKLQISILEQNYILSVR